MKRFPCIIPQCHVLIVGLGLIGASYAKALSARGYTVSAITRKQEVIDRALSDGVIVRGAATPDPSLIAEADIVVLGLYPTVLLDWLRENAVHLRAGTVVTDVTGVKGCMIEEAQALMPEGVEYISAHPMAGRELTGTHPLAAYEAADPEIFRGANYLVVPTEKNTPDGITLCEQLGRVLGFARVTRLTVKEHDTMIAYLSQLTHAIAVALMCCAGEGEQQTDISRLAALTGDSFRDLTRIAKINDGMWSELFLSNREALLAQMDRFAARFDTMREALSQGNADAMRQMMRLSTDRRRAFDRESR